MENWDNQPFFVINDEAYENIMMKLRSGESKFEKTYAHLCPHKNKNDCKCKFHINFLKDDELVRCVNGELKPVLSVSQYKMMMSKLSIR